MPQRCLIMEGWRSRRRDMWRTLEKRGRGTLKGRYREGKQRRRGSDSDGSDIEEVIVDEKMQGTFVELLNLNQDMLLILLLYIPWEAIHTMTNFISRICDCT